MLKKTLSACVLFLVFCFVGSDLCAQQDYPNGWPWRGVVLEGQADENQIKFLASSGANAVQIYLPVRLYAERHGFSPGAALEFALQYADRVLDWCKKYKLIGFVSVSQYPFDYRLGINQDSPLFWNSDKLQRELLWSVDVVSRHLSSRGDEFGAYEFISEPVYRGRDDVRLPDGWLVVQRKIINKIRENDKSRFIIVTPGLGGSVSGYVGFNPYEDRRIIYGAHFYFPHAYSHQGVKGFRGRYRYPGLVGGVYLSRKVLMAHLSSFVSFKDRWKVPVLIGEFSAARWAEGGDLYVQDLISNFNESHVAWTYYSYAGFHAWNPMYSNEFCDLDCGRQYVGDAAPRWSVLRAGFRYQR